MTGGKRAVRAGRAGVPDPGRCADLLVEALTSHRGIRAVEVDRTRAIITVRFEADRLSRRSAERLASRLGREFGRRLGACDLAQVGLLDSEWGARLRSALATRAGGAEILLALEGGRLHVAYRDGEAGLAEVRRPLAAPLDPSPEGVWRRRLPALRSAGCLVFLLAGAAASWLGLPPPLSRSLYALAYLSGGLVEARNAVRSLRSGVFDVNGLMVAAAIGAAAIDQWAEGAILLFLFSLSNALEAYAMDRTRQALRALVALRPAEATLLKEGKAVRVAVEDLEVGDRILVKPGERIPADGGVLDGHSAVDQSPITGESLPVPKGIGSGVFAGTINGQGTLEIEVSKPHAETTLAKVIQLVEEAQSVRVPAQRIIDRFGNVYAVGVASTAVVMAVLPVLAFGVDPAAAIYRAITLLVVGSPCALVISTPASVLSAIANAARQGVLFKGGAYLEALGRVRAVAFDKTGTITRGIPVVTDVLPADGTAEEEVLGLAAAVEGRSEHLLGQAVVTEARRRGIAPADAADLQAVVGRGVVARVNGQAVAVGSQAFLGEREVPVPAPLRQAAERLQAAGKTVIFVADGTTRGLIAVADQVRPEAAAVVQSLRGLGVLTTVMLTGDNRRVAEAVGAAVGVDEVQAELLPEAKAEVVLALREKHRDVAMVGDGVNDAPALARASVGVAMGAAGSDVALETADVILMGDDLTKLPYALALSQQARRVIWENLGLSAVIIVSLVLSAVLGLISLPIGVVGHEGNTLLVVANGLRLLRFRPAA
ncbi:MAG: heavy metal translocating P-type ATPase [candidate division NC10 bacterium]|nr:heavy metal translocating P-type ATPase [candidate division NC10 bacterium]